MYPDGIAKMIRESRNFKALVGAAGAGEAAKDEPVLADNMDDIPF